VNERVIVRFISRSNKFISDPKHVLFGGLHDSAKRRYVVPRLSNGAFVNVLTNNEKGYLEAVMGLQPNSLSIYKLENNYWEGKYVELHKGDNVIDLSTPEGYINYKILLANKEYICPSEEEFDRSPYATYAFIIISERNKNKRSVEKFTNKALAYKYFEANKGNLRKLLTICNMVNDTRYLKNTPDEQVLTMCGELIETRTKAFISAMEDDMLDIKVLLLQGLDVGVIRRANGLYSLESTGQPLCFDGQNATIEIACAYLNSPRNQDLLFKLQSKVRDLYK
jgi:hypothetical protein